MNFKPWIRVNEIGPNNAFGGTLGRKAHGSTKTILKKTKQLFRGIQATIKADNWPTPNYSTLVSDPTFLFIITPPFSGSTALAQVLNSERSVIGAALRSHEELLQFFGYTSDWEKDLEQGGAANLRRVAVTTEPRPEVREN